MRHLPQALPERPRQPLLITPFIQEYRDIIDALPIDARLYGHLSLRLLADFFVIHQPRNQQLKIARQGLTVDVVPAFSGLNNITPAWL